MDNTENTIPYIKDEPASQKHEDKLYLVTHANLSAGYQTAQTAHVIAEFIMSRPEVARTWHRVSNSIIVLETKDAESLSDLLVSAENKGLDVVIFREPDFGDEITALAFSPSQSTKEFLSELPCAGRNLKNQKSLRDREKRLRSMAFAMMDCEQTAGQNVLQHGRSVREHYFALVQHMEGRIDLSHANNWKVPTWIDENKELILASLPKNYIMDRYLTLHDCGKPTVREIDEVGRSHFPEHANASYETYKDTFQDEANETVGYLILHDMDIHMLKADGLQSFSERETVFAHLLAGLAELTSNAAMFGGIQSTSFKIKYKQIDQRGKALCKILTAK